MSNPYNVSRVKHPTQRSYLEAAQKRTFLQAASKYMEVEYHTQPAKDVCDADRQQICALWMESFNAVVNWRDFGYGGDSVAYARYKYGQRQIVAVCVTSIRGGPCRYDHYEGSDSENEGRGECSILGTCSDRPVVLDVKNFCAFPKKHGYGRGLINYVKDVATRSDVTAVTLKVNIEDVGQTIFYQKQGFVKPRWPRPGEIDFEMRYDIREPVHITRKKIPRPAKQKSECFSLQYLMDAQRASQVQVEEIDVDIDAMTPEVPNRIWVVGVLAPGDAETVHEASRDWGGVHDDVIHMVKTCMTKAVFGRPVDGFSGTCYEDYIQLKRGKQYIFAKWDNHKTVSVYYGHFDKEITIMIDKFKFDDLCFVVKLDFNSCE